MDIMTDLCKKSRNGNILFVSIETKNKKFSAFTKKKKNSQNVIHKKVAYCSQD